MRVIAIEEHWTTARIDQALRSGGHDPSVVLNDRGDIPERLLDLGDGRIEAMDAAGVDVQIVSIAPPGAHGLPAEDAVALSREANDLAAEAVGRHPDRLRAMTTLPMPDPDAAVAELERTEGLPGHVGLMSYGRSGDRPLDDPAYDELLATAARLGRPVFVHPQIPPDAVREASYRGFEPVLELSLATFGWGWHIEAGLAALRLIVGGTFDRHPDLQIVLGHWGEMLLFALDRVDSLSGVATHLERRVADYFATNIHIATSGMMAPRLLRHALDYTGTDRILLSGDYPFHRWDATSVGDFLENLPDPQDRRRIAHANAEALYRLDTPANIEERA
ncbi:amidohydrolase family protein [Amycolatopsis sp. PS_44_ISF1]|uniref:amidohydrolase family protein n=1 Tax=Amycolatopsis sp. PS_44_ISF1 TaxID=2974917 RepID=UPI0028DEEB00|nr:amidohydrolase family protein [Amycolatopsis sp. PS_44_ISF1]MDT8911416.1 amidohydrolase family protein [Amycolatopsis sp. PS_44_ISF1]